ncbi:hypothetical protein [Tautonia plasticadhaerens]|uniref:Uncharacterized protein n=1 Tax=Tautonia plasticadhaerens TaxID=2527974 RepID=A0A518H1M0_9BACT|nr:hypothetical protein [Tautonia plasticadhaerens]QDV34734.1 hypothetical protein ElP_26280 [Tautonia plasticadhaerens]
MIAETCDRPRPGGPRSTRAALGLIVMVVVPGLRAQEVPPPGPVDLPPSVISRAEGTPGGGPDVVVPPPSDPGFSPVLGDDRGPQGIPAVSYAEAGLKAGKLAEPGSTVELDIADGEAEPADLYRWIQVEGPRVELKRPDGRTVEVEVPGGASRLSFLRIEARAGAVRVVRFVVPVEGGEPSGPARADAGDDQVGLVGHRVTLNGSASRPDSGLVLRWIQVAGPPILAPKQEREYYSFVPTAQGLYQFALVVGVGGEISEPDGVSVLVGSAPMGSGLSPAAMNGTMNPASPATMAGSAPPNDPAVTSPEAVVASALPGLAEGDRLAGEVADVFQAVAERSTLYTSFGDAQSELSRRLDVVIPSDPARRLAWSQALLQPLTGFTIAQMQSVGLDVRQPASMDRPLTPPQRERMEDQFQALARAFREASGRSLK